MDECDLIDNWRTQKASTNYRRLTFSAEVEYEFAGRLGHPSQYALVKFLAIPADQLSLEFEVDWPSEFDAEYTARIEHSIAEAVVDALLSSHTGKYPHDFPFRGCALRLIGFGFHAVSGSEASVYYATILAMARLRNECEWSDVLGRYRRYPK